MAEQSRVPQIQSAMEDAGVDAVVLRLAENIVLATRWYVQIPGLAFVVIGRSGGATLMIPDYEAEEAAAIWPGDIRTFPAIRFDGPATGVEIQRHLRDLARELGAAGGTIGYEGSFESIAPASIHGEPNAVAAPDAGADQVDLRDRAASSTSPSRSSRFGRSRRRRRSS